MSQQLPPLSPRVIRELAEVVGKEWLFHGNAERLAYSYDASIVRSWPQAVCLPASAAEVSALLRIASREKIPFVARGAGTGIAGGSVPVQGGLVLALSRMNRILELNVPDRLAVVEPGVVNLALGQSAERLGYTFRPDPSSQKVSTVGGNAACNAGGPHCLAYGVTANHVLALEVVLPDGRIVEVGARHADAPGYDLTGLLVGSEGTMGVVTKLVCRLARCSGGVKTLLASYTRMEDAAASVSAIIAAGIVPAALEMMDGPIIRAVEDYIHAGYPVEAAAVLLVEVEGPVHGLEGVCGSIESICRQHGAATFRAAASEEERARLWAGRKGALGAVARIKPKYYLHDGVVPRTRLLDVLRQVAAIGLAQGLTIVNVFHAGDGNLHPFILFDPANPGELEKVHEAGRQILRACVDAGGTLSGEHGIGAEKNEMMDWVYSPEDLQAMKRLRAVFDPLGLANPGKMFPTGVPCCGVGHEPGLPVSDAGGLWV